MHSASDDRKSLVYKGMPPDHCCCGPTLRFLPDGTWIVPFLTGGRREPEPENYVGLCRSTDRGRTWGELETVLRLDDRACLFSECFVEGDTVTMFVQTHSGAFGDWQNFTITGTDGARTWSEPRPLEALPRRAFTWRRMVASWGEWLVPYQRYEVGEDLEASPHADGAFRRARNGVLISSDGGSTWEASESTGPTAGWAENNVVELSDERLVMLIRADGTGRLRRSESRDRGRTWSPPEPTEIPNPGSKFRLHRLRDGRIVLIHNPNSATGDPNSKEQAAVNRNPLAMWISEDEMESWTTRRVLTDFPGMLAYPDGVVDEAEEYVHFAFDYNRHDVIYWGARLPDGRES